MKKKNIFFDDSGANGASLVRVQSQIVYVTIGPLREPLPPEIRVLRRYVEHVLYDPVELARIARERGEVE